MSKGSPEMEHGNASEIAQTVLLLSSNDTDEQLKSATRAFPGLDWTRSADAAQLCVHLLPISASRDDLRAAITQCVNSTLPVIIALETWDEAAAQTLADAGAADCFDLSAPQADLPFRFSQVLARHEPNGTALKTLRWEYDVQTGEIELSAPFAAYFSAQSVKVPETLEEIAFVLGGSAGRKLLSAMEEVLVSGQQITVQHAMRAATLDAMPVNHRLSPLLQGPGGPRLIIGSFDAPSALLRVDQERSHTKVLSERGFTRAVDIFLKRQKNRVGLQAAMCLVSVDRFEQMNVLLGRNDADRLLDEVAVRLDEAVEAYKQDRGTQHAEAIAVGRLGGAQFAVAIEGPLLAKSAEQLAQQLIASFDEPFLAGHQRLFLAARIGISLASASDKQADALISRANLALNDAMRGAAGTYRIFDPRNAARAQNRVVLGADLRDAIGKDSLFAQYMPIVNTVDGSVAAVEALVRWRHPELGLLPPDRFIPMAEESGAIADVGQWVFERALREFAQAADKLPDGVRLAINVSADQFHRGDLEDMLTAQLAACGLDERRLILEVTETLVMEDYERAKAIMSALQARGVKISVDDFGTGFSALTYLKNLNFDEIKLDRSFIVDLTEGSDSAIEETMVDAMISIAKSHNLKVVAEGVENERQYEFLKARGCHYCQGYYFAPPMSMDDLITFTA